MRSLALICALSLLSATLVRADEPAKKADEKTETVANPPKKYGWALLGAAVPCLVIGIGLGGAALGRAGEQNGDPTMPAIYTTDLHDRGREGQAMATAGYVFIGFGVLFAILDVVMWFEILRKPREMATTKTARRGDKPQLRAAAGGLEVRF